MRAPHGGAQALDSDTWILDGDSSARAPEGNTRLPDDSMAVEASGGL